MTQPLTQPRTSPSTDFAANDQAAEEVLAGLNQTRRRLPSKYFYDRRGSELFDRICELPEYYLTRTEIGIMRAHAAEMAACIGNDSLLIEYGSGSSLKIRLLLDQLTERDGLAGYAPVDVSRAHLMNASDAIVADYPKLAVHPICADFTNPFTLPVAAETARRVVYFPGSTIGNFPAPAAIALLSQIAGQIAGQGGALIGIDLQKPDAILHAAYNDVQGVTADFNLNILTHINRAVGANFDIENFAHRAFYNAERGCMEMHLVSLREQVVTVAGQRVTLAAGETIHTEDSHKYTIAGFTELAAQA
ncbi:MAG: L-histidine N(alpha)-methyltransferase, partial [Nannocystaceae bacterium]